MRRTTKVLLLLSPGFMVALAIPPVVLLNWDPLPDGKIPEVILESLALFFGGWAIYVLPSVVAFLRRHPSTVPIMVLNLLGGWTVLGYVGSLIWALTAPSAAANVALYVPPDIAGQLARLADLRTRGILTESEFQTQKARLLA